MKKMQYKDLVGKVVHKVYQTPWRNFEGTDACDIYLLIDEGLVELEFIDDLPKETDEVDILDVNIISKLRDVEFMPKAPSCDGKTITAVLRAELCKILAFALDNELVIYARDWGSPFVFGAWIIPISMLDKDEMLVIAGEFNSLI